MVKQVMTFGGSGLSDWLIQRISGLVIASYIIFMTAYFLPKGGISYPLWAGLFSHMSMKIYTLMVIMSLAAHAWIGIWTIFTDYVHCACIRLGLMTLVVLSLLALVIWGAVILWGM